MRKMLWLIVPLLAFLTLPQREDSRPNAEAAPAPFSRKTRGSDLGINWPMFGGTAARNLVNLHARDIVDDFDVKTGRNVRWSVPLGGSCNLCAPAVIGSRLFIGANNDYPRDPNVLTDRGVMLCLCVHNGHLLWQIAHEKLDQHNDCPRVGIVSSPSVDGDRVYYVSNRAEVVCADICGDGTGKGKILWSFDMVKELGVFPGQHSIGSPLVFGDGVYVVTANGVDPGTGKLPAPNAPSFLALDKMTGKVLWHSNLPGKNVMRGQWSSPAAAKVNGQRQIVFAGGDGWMYSFDEKGNLLWKFDCNPKKYRPYKPGGSGERNFIIATPVIHDNKCYIATGQEPDDGTGIGDLWCIDMTKTPKNREKDLSPVNDNFDSKAPVNRDSGLVWHYGGPETDPAYLDEAKDTFREFRFGRTMGTLAIHDGLLYAAELSGYLHCLDAKTGKRLWLYDFQEGTWNSPTYADGKVFVGTDAGYLYVFQHGKKLVPPHKINVRWSMKAPAVAANGVLYVNVQNSLYAIARP